MSNGIIETTQVIGQALVFSTDNCKIFALFSGPLTSKKRDTVYDNVRAFVNYRKLKNVRLQTRTKQAVIRRGVDYASYTIDNGGGVTGSGYVVHPEFAKYHNKQA